jgi:hypothetical protein
MAVWYDDVMLAFVSFVFGLLNSVFCCGAFDNVESFLERGTTEKVF